MANIEIDEVTCLNIEAPPWGWDRRSFLWLEIENLDIEKVTHHDIRGHVTYDSKDSIVISWIYTHTFIPIWTSLRDWDDKFTSRYQKECDLSLKFIKNLNL